MDFDIEKHHYLTTYRKSYVEKPIRRTSKALARQEFRDPISAGFNVYLLLEDEAGVPPNENVEEYVDKFKEKYKGVAKVYFKEPLDKSAIMKNKTSKEIVSEYQMNYCDVEEDLKYYLEQQRKKTTLSDDAIIPITTYRAYHRNPADFRGGKLEKPIIIKPKGEMEIAGKYSCTPRSEYSRYIGKLATTILETSYEKHKGCPTKEIKNNQAD